MTACLEYQDIYGTISVDDPDWNGGARSIDSFDGDCWYGFEVTQASVGVICGLNSDDVSAHYGEIDFAFRFERGTFGIMENGVAQGPAMEPYFEGDKFYLVRIDNDVLYCVREAGLDPTDYYIDPRYFGIQLPGYIYLVSSKQSFGTVFLDCSMYMAGDQIFNECLSGVTWSPGVESEGETYEFTTVSGLLPFTGQISQGVDGVIYGYLPVELYSMEGSSPVTVAAQLPFSVLASDQPLNTLVIGQLPFEAFADSGGIYTVIQGVNGALIFDVEAAGGVRSTGIEGELGFDAFGVHTDFGMRLDSGIVVGELSFTAFAIGSQLDAQLSSGADISLGFSAFSTSRPSTDDPIRSGAFPSLPFDVFGTGTADGETAYDAGIYGEFAVYARATHIEVPTYEAISAGVFGELAFSVTSIAEIPDTSVTAGMYIPFPFAAYARGAAYANPEIASGIEGNLGLTAFATHRPSASAAIKSGIFPHLAFNTFAIGRAAGETAYTSGVFAQLPFAAEATTSTLRVTVTGVSSDLPFDVFSTSRPSTDPVMTSGISAELPFAALAAGTITQGAVTTWITGDLPFAGFAIGAEDSEAAISTIGYADLAFAVTGYMEAHTENFFDIFLSFSATTEDGPAGEANIQEIIYALSVMVRANNVMLQRSRVVVDDTWRTFYTRAVSVQEDVLVLAAQRANFVLRLADEIESVDTITFRYVMQLADSLLAAGAVQTFYQGVVEVLAAFYIADANKAAYAKTLLEQLATEDSISYRVSRIAEFLDTVLVEGTAAVTLTIFVEELAEFAADDTLELTAQYFANLIDRTEVLAFVKTPAELAQGWVMNTEGAMPVSEYDNYIFNSMAYSNREMLGCSDQGLYVLDGDDDDGTDIAARLTSLMLDFDTSKLKRMSTAYIGYSSSGRLLLKVRSVDQGLFVEHWYEGRNPEAQVPPGQNRMKLGKGLRSRYWTFELVNIDGSDFELDKVELYPIVLDRRI